MEQLRCNNCGRFMSLYDKDAVTYTPFGHPTDLDPPEAEYICGRCWRVIPQPEQESMNEIYWIPPHHIII